MDTLPPAASIPFFSASATGEVGHECVVTSYDDEPTLCDMAIEGIDDDSDLQRQQ